LVVDVFAREFVIRSSRKMVGLRRLVSGVGRNSMLGHTGQKRVLVVSALMPAIGNGNLKIRVGKVVKTGRAARSKKPVRFAKRNSR